MTDPLRRLSFAARARGWHDDATALEQRLKDLETFDRSHRRRWAIAAALFVLGVLGKLGGVTDTRLGTIVLVAGGAAVVNAIVGLINERGWRGWYRWWFIYMLPLLDVVLVNLLVIWFGHGGVVAALFIAVLPYAFDQGQAVGDFLVLVASIAYLLATWAHGELYPGESGLDTIAYLETGVFIVVAMALKRIPATLIQRIRHARSVMGEAEQGYLAVRAAAAEADELGFLEKSFNRMLEEIGTTISSVQREADEVAAFAEELAAAAQELHATTESLTQTSQRLAGDLGSQRGLADGARGESAKAADQAESLRVMRRGSSARQSGDASASRAQARRSVRWAKKYARRHRPSPACRECRSGSASSRRRLPGSRGKPIYSRSTQRLKRRERKNMAKASRSSPTRSAA